MPHNLVISDSKVLDAHTIKGFTPEFVQVPGGGGRGVRHDIVTIKNSSNMQYIFDKDMEWLFHENIIDIGKVAELKHIKIKPRIRKKQLCKKIHEKNYLVLKSEEFKQIRLTAKWDGIVVWPSLFFKFSHKNEEDTFYEIFGNYLLDVHNLKEETVKVIVKTRNFNNIKRYLKPANKIWFTDWYDLENTIVFEMHKDIV